MDYNGVETEWTTMGRNRMDYNGVGDVRNQQHIPFTNWPKYHPHSPMFNPAFNFIHLTFMYLFLLDLFCAGVVQFCPRARET